jgi:glycosyltransferase involved in cell wall biosynthesis
VGRAAGNRRPRADRAAALAIVAADGAGWPLTVACSARELGRVRVLGAASAGRILAEVPRPEHDRLLRSAAVYAIPLRDQPGSAGQVRLAAATEAGTPVVASAVEALEGYVVDGETGLVVPPGDPGALRSAVDRLLAEPALGRRLAAEAAERGCAWTYRDYFAAVRELIDDALAGRALPARAPAAPPAPSARESAGAARGGPGA